jgi:hypothetical protein
MAYILSHAPDVADGRGAHESDSRSSPDSEDGQTLVNTPEISIISGNERDAQRDGDCRNEEIEAARRRVSANGSNRGA